MIKNEVVLYIVMWNNLQNTKWKKIRCKIVHNTSSGWEIDIFSLRFYKCIFYVYNSTQETNSVYLWEKEQRFWGMDGIFDSNLLHFKNFVPCAYIAYFKYTFKIGTALLIISLWPWDKSLPLLGFSIPIYITRELESITLHRRNQKSCFQHILDSYLQILHLQQVCSLFTILCN